MSKRVNQIAKETGVKWQIIVDIINDYRRPKNNPNLPDLKNHANTLVYGEEEILMSELRKRGLVNNPGASSEAFDQDHSNSIPSSWAYFSKTFPRDETIQAGASSGELDPTGLNSVPTNDAHISKTIQVKKPITVRELATQLGVSPFKLVSELPVIGIYTSMNAELNEYDAHKIAMMHGYKIEIIDSQSTSLPQADSPQKVNLPQAIPQTSKFAPQKVTNQIHLKHINQIAKQTKVSPDILVKLIKEIRLEQNTTTAILHPGSRLLIGEEEPLMKKLDQKGLLKKHPEIPEKFVTPTLSLEDLQSRKPTSEIPEKFTTPPLSSEDLQSRVVLSEVPEKFLTPPLSKEDLQSRKPTSEIPDKFLTPPLPSSIQDQKPAKISSIASLANNPSSMAGVLAPKVSETKPVHSTQTIVPEIKAISAKSQNDSSQFIPTTIDNENWVNPGQKSGRIFESQVEHVLKLVIPESFLTSVPAFPSDSLLNSPSDDGITAMSTEVDFLLHLRNDQQDWLLLIEVKVPDLKADVGYRAHNSSPWSLIPKEANEKSYDVKKQVIRQAAHLKKNVQPLDPRKTLRFMGLIVSKYRKDTHDLLDDTGEVVLHLTSFERLSEWLHQILRTHKILRVQQSPILRRLRQGQATTELGHPEIPNAIGYSRRVRAFLDSQLFRHLEFPPRQWAINGSAGMGKSVLLSYALTVLVTDGIVDTFRDGFIQIGKLQQKEIMNAGLPSVEKRRIIMAAHSDKQRLMLTNVYERIQQRYHEIDPYQEHRKIKPLILSWSEVSEDDLSHTNVLLIDEAHDLTEDDQARVKKWFDGDESRYLIIACDRHQKLRLISRNSRMLNGFDFTRKTLRLNRNYRNPFPVHASAVGLLFRWFALDGPKVAPSEKDYKDGLGINVLFKNDHEVQVGAREDAHPANNWSHLVGKFHSPAEALEQLRETALGKEDVLWVRFGSENSQFNYESLNAYTYHNLLSTDAAEVTDKYIKGQEFPIVIIEGLPKDAAWDDKADNQRLSAMWQARRLIYLAASRATVFLFFVESHSDHEDLRHEVENLIGQLARPHTLDTDPTAISPSGKKWSFSFQVGSYPVKLRDYNKLLGSEFSDSEDSSES